MRMGLQLTALERCMSAGYTTSTDLPNTLPGQTLSGPTDGYVMKIPAAGNQVAFSAYIGGSNDDYILGIAIDPSSNIYVTGRTNSTNVPHSGTFQSGLAGNDDAFVSKLNSSGARLYWTYIGGSENDIGRSIAADATGAAYITGDTSSSNFPVTAGVLQSTFGGRRRCFRHETEPERNRIGFLHVPRRECLRYRVSELQSMPPGMPTSPARPYPPTSYLSVP